jgi:hypothetical protein
MFLEESTALYCDMRPDRIRQPNKLPLLGNSCVSTQEYQELLGAVYSTWSVPRANNRKKTNARLKTFRTMTFSGVTTKTGTKAELP